MSRHSYTGAHYSIALIICLIIILRTFSLMTRYIYGKYFYGINESDGKYAVTTSSVGWWWAPQRLGSQSDIVLIRIQSRE